MHIEDIETKLILDAVFMRYGYDFREYSEASIRRRLRKVMCDYNYDSFAMLQHRLLHDEEFFSRILNHLTVTTSEMFRDPDYYLTIREKVVPILATYPSFKVWHAGCSTGEEVYSLAILLHEVGLYHRATIYATDINTAALKRAKDGFFEVDRVPKFTTNYQKSGGTNPFSTYYIAGYGSIRMEPALKRNVVFAEHNLVTDDVFSEFHLILCRNVLIYFDRGLQNRVVDLFGKSLCHRGFLCLGSKESVQFVEGGKQFEDFDKTVRIYRKAVSKSHREML